MTQVMFSEPQLRLIQAGFEPLNFLLVEEVEQRGRLTDATMVFSRVGAKMDYWIDGKGWLYHVEEQRDYFDYFDFFDPMVLDLNPDKQIKVGCLVIDDLGFSWWHIDPLADIPFGFKEIDPANMVLEPMPQITS